MTMTKAERDSLISLVKGRFKLLRHDIETRKKEMIAELGQRLDQQFAAPEKEWDDAQFLIKEARDECNRKVNDLLRTLCQKIGQEYPERSDYDVVVVRDVGNPIPGRKDAARRQALKDIEAVEQNARHELAVAENELLTELLTGSLESAEARAFVNRIPSVSALMIPTARLAALVGPTEETTANG